MTDSQILIPPIDLENHEKVATATFCLGCFWGPDGQFGAMDGVIRTRVGYAGGQTADPTYHNIGDHIETLELDFDSDKITFEEIVDIFWNNHNPIGPSWKRQYINAIFFHDDNQRDIINKTKEKLSSRYNEQITTEIIPYDKFYLAENYHQKYHLQNVPLLINDYKKIFTSMQQFIDSTSAARVNGFLRGYGSVEDFDNNIDRLGLSEQPTAILKDLFYKYRKKAV
jgi:peptide-methionine (S)-S-oxide reductase